MVVRGCTYQHNWRTFQSSVGLADAECSQSKFLFKNFNNGKHVTPTPSAMNDHLQY